MFTTKKTKGKYTFLKRGNEEIFSPTPSKTKIEAEFTSFIVSYLFVVKETKKR